MSSEKIYLQIIANLREKVAELDAQLAQARQLVRQLLDLQTEPPWPDRLESAATEFVNKE